MPKVGVAEKGVETKTNGGHIGGWVDFRVEFTQSILLDVYIKETDFLWYYLPQNLSRENCSMLAAETLEEEGMEGLCLCGPFFQLN